jgi:two-component system NarL family response regulator
LPQQSDNPYVETPRVPKIRVLLIEDSHLLRDGITRILSAEKDVEVISSADNNDSLEKVYELVPDVVLLHSKCNSQDRLREVGLITGQFPAMCVVVMDLIPAEAGVVKPIDAGVADPILRNTTLHDFLRTATSIARDTKSLPSPTRGSLFFFVCRAGDSKLDDAT